MALRNSTKSALSVAIGAAMMIGAVHVATPAFATPVKNKQAANMMSMCLLQDDYLDAVANPKEEGWVGCCSRTLGYCIECPTDGRGQCHTNPIWRISVKDRPKAPDAGKIAPRPKAHDPRGSASGKLDAAR